jgi:hypothetical protein
MGHKIRMAPAVEEWAARLNASVRSTWRSMPASREASRILGKVGFWIARPALDAAYQQHFAELLRTLRAVADVAPQPPPRADQRAGWVTVNSGQSPSGPPGGCLPQAAKSMSDPASRSLTVRETRISPGRARTAIR